MKCLIIAAGQGTRLADLGDSKPLVPLMGKPLIMRVIETARQGGATEFYVVTGYQAQKVKSALEAYAEQQNVAIHFVDNDEWLKQNGISVLKAKELLDEPFFLLMSDHMFDSSILSHLTQSAQSDERQFSVVLAVDSRLEDNPLVDLDDVTKVKQVEGFIKDIGKTIPQYNAFDTGIFYCTPDLFSALEESIENGDSSLSGGIKVLAAKQKAGIMDIGNATWIDVDNEEMFKKAEIVLGEKEK